MSIITENRWKQISKALSSIRNLDEENTKRKIIDPILLDLGWDLFGEDVHKEYKIQVGSKIDSVDYALLVDDTPKIFIEVKKLGLDLTDSHAKQVLSYAFIERVRWCLLSNGRRFKIYNTDWGASPKNTLFCSFDLDPNSNPPEELTLLSKSLVERGELDRQAIKFQLNIRVRALLSKSLDDLKNDILKNARNKIYQQLKREMPSVTRDKISNVIKSLLQIQLAKEEFALEVKPSATTEITKTLRTDIHTLPDERVAVFPSKPDGIKWMHRYSAWGYVRIKELPKYLALYVSKPVHGIQYLAEIEKIVDPADPESPVRDCYRDDPTYKLGKKVIILKKGSIQKLDPEVALGKTSKGRIQGLRFCRLDALRKAKTTDDLW